MRVFYVSFALVCIIFSLVIQAATISHSTLARPSTTELQEQESGSARTVDSHTESHEPIDDLNETNGQNPSNEVDESVIDAHPFKFILHNFPSTTLLHTARIGVLDALELAHAGLIGLDHLTSSYHRYFDPSDLGLVKNIFESITTKSIHLNPANTKVVHIWHNDVPDTADCCQKGLNVYHMLEKANNTKSSIVLCPSVLFRHAYLLDSITENEIPDHNNEMMETLGLIILHELIHLTPLTGGPVALNQQTQSTMRFNPANKLNKGTDYSAYLSMRVNKNEKAGSQNATNYVFYAAESYFMQTYGIASFLDPQLSGLMNYALREPAAKTSAHSQSGGFRALNRRRVPATEADDKIRGQLAARDVLPPIRLPAPGWPQNFLLVNFPRETGPNENMLIGKVANGLADSWRLAENAFLVLSTLPPSTSFNRYFQNENLCIVRAVFKAIIDDLQIAALGPVVSQRKWSIHWGDSGLEHVSPSCQGEEARTTDAYSDYLDPDTRRQPIIFVCPGRFSSYARPLNDLTCGAIGNRAHQDTMDSWAYLFLHETLHDQTLTFPIVGEEVDDVMIEYADSVVTCYGPWWSYLINLTLEHAGLNICNNDNYVFFALEEWFRGKCGRNFIEPTMGHLEWLDIVGGHATRRQKRDVVPKRRSHSSPSQLASASQPMTDSARQLIVARDVLPPTRLPDGWPQNFLFINFVDPNMQHAMGAGFLDMWLVVENSLRVLSEQPPSGSFYRYFRPDQVCFVHAALKALLDAADFAAGTDQLFSSRRTWEIYWGDELAPRPACHRGLFAFYTQLDVQTGSRPAIFLCPDQILSPLHDIETLRLANMRCDMIGNRANFDKFWSWAYMLMHESLHDTEIGPLLFGERINDQLIPYLGDIRKCYGPWWSFYLNNNFGHLSYINVDNYVSFALEEWFSAQCGYVYQNPAMGWTDQTANWNYQGPLKALQNPRSTRPMIYASLQLVPDATERSQNNSSYLSELQSSLATDHAASANIVARADVFPPMVPLIPKWPQNLIFVNFPKDRPELFDWAYNGVIDAAMLAENAHRALSEKLPSKSFYRYFQAGQECLVRNMFARLLDEFFDPVARLGPLPVVNRLFWTVHYDHIVCYKDATLLAAYVYNQASGPLITLCPHLFGKPDFPYVRRLESVPCDQIGDQARLPRMVNIGGVLLHEILHGEGMTRTVSGLVMTDIAIQRNGATKLGYGPWWTSYLNINTNNAILNDDNWVWFAQEEWFRKKCGSQFPNDPGDPYASPNPADNADPNIDSGTGAGPR